MNRTTSPEIIPAGLPPLLAPCELAQQVLGDLIVALVFQPHP